MLVRGVLGTATVTVGDPDCWQIENIAKAIVGQGSGQIGQDVRRALRAAFQRRGDKMNPRVIWIQPGGLKGDFIGGANANLVKSLAVQMPAQRWHDVIGVGSHDKPQLAGCTGMA